jgi:hypothetical protein
MDPATYAMMQNMRAEKAAKVAVKSEPSDTPLYGKKRKLGEDDDAKDTSGVSTRQDWKPQHAPDRHDGDAVDWEAARQLLEGIVTPARERAFQVANPFNVIASSYVATLQVWVRSSLYSSTRRATACARTCVCHLLMARAFWDAGGELRDGLAGARAEAPGRAG